MDRRHIATLAALVAGLAFAGGCARESAPLPAGPVLVLGIDGAEWSVMQPLLDGGELPNIAGLIQAGASGKLRTLDPLRRSPVIWTVIATGKPPEENGIGGPPSAGGPTRDPSTLTSNMWVSPAFWDVAGRSGLRAVIVGWLVTWPAREVNGAMVSEHIHHLEAYARAGRAETLTHPPELCAEIAPLVRSPDSVTDAELSRFVDTANDPGLRALEGNNGMVLRGAISGDETVVAVALSLTEPELPDLMCVYMRGVDETSHAFWVHTDAATRPPADPAKPSTIELERQARALEGALPEYYRYADELVGKILARFPPSTTVVVCSDHGFRGPGPWGSGRPHMGEEQHGLDGVLIMEGPGIVPGAAIEGATVYDVAPTILALSGLPVGRDLDGRVLKEALTPQFLRSKGVRYVDTNDGEERPHDIEPIESPADEEIRERMKALGYIN